MIDERSNRLLTQGDLASRTLVLESKRFYLDVKENQRGRFIKIAEISADGRKNQILMTFSTAALFSQNLVAFIDFYKDLEKVDPDNLKQGELKSEVEINLISRPSAKLHIYPRQLVWQNTCADCPFRLVSVYHHDCH